MEEVTINYINYKEYIQSDEWKEKSKKWILEAGACERCSSGYGLTCHHKDYKNLGHERRKDVMVLCWNCHKKYHRVGDKRIKVAIFQKKLEGAKENYKEYVLLIRKLNQMKTEFLRKGKIRGISKKKSRKLIEQMNNG